MSRLPRLFLPGVPQHVIQRGNDRRPIFFATDDYVFCRECLAYAARKCGVAIHAYVLMTNHMHLLATPTAPTSLPKMMQSVGRVYVKYFNDKYERTGTLWEGRYKAAIVDDESYLLTCMRYIELNPLRAGMVASPREYPWSSFRANVSGYPDQLIAHHPVFAQLGTTPEDRRGAYQELFRSAISEADITAIRDATQNAWALGTAAFCRKASALSRRAERLRAGRRRVERTEG
jgi:putative transposase